MRNTSNNTYSIVHSPQMIKKLKLARLQILSLQLNLQVIKTHGSESRGQEEAGLRDEPVSYLQVAPL